MTYRKIVTDFWNDSTVEDLSSAAKYVLLYLLTAPMGSVSGCYEVTRKRISKDTDVGIEQVESALSEIVGSGIAEYDDDTSEVLLRNWSRYNWNMSPNTTKSLLKSIKATKSTRFREYLLSEYEAASKLLKSGCEAASKMLKSNLEDDTEHLRRSPYSVSVSVTDSVAKEDTEQLGTSKRVETKHQHGAFSNVLLSDDELDKLKASFPDWKKRIDDLSYYIGSTGKSYKSHYRTILSWARKEQPKEVSSKNARFD